MGVNARDYTCAAVLSEILGLLPVHAFDSALAGRCS